MTAAPIPTGAVLRLTWGEPADEITAIVQRWTTDGVIVSLVNDLTQLDGYTWLAATAIESMAVLDADDAAVRHLAAVGIRCDADQVDHVSLTSLLAGLQRSGELVFFQDVEDGSDAGSVGRVLRVEEETVVFSDIDVDGRDTGDELERRLDELDTLTWDDTYVRALTVLNALD